jgi:hypothetical protein
MKIKLDCIKTNQILQKNKIDKFTVVIKYLLI